MQNPTRPTRSTTVLLVPLLLAAVITAPLRAVETPVVSGPPPSHTEADVTRAFAPVEARIQGWLDRGCYAGASLVVAQDGQVLWRKRFGEHRDDSVEYIASSGKWLAAAAVMAVIDEGKLGLDDPAAKWIPAFTGTKGRATVRQMLSHTSGYPTYQPAGRHPDDYQTLAESVAAIAPLDAAAEPGAVWDYGGLAMQVAGRMAELATGEEWEALFQRTIAKPLGMTATHFTPVDSGGFGHTPMLAGGARSSLEDYRRFLAMISAGGVYEGRRVLSERSIAELQADQVGTATFKPSNFVTGVRGATHHGIYGLGEWRELEDDHGRAVLISSPSWAGTYPWIDHRHHLQAVFLAHVHGPLVGKFDQFNPMTSSAELPLLVDQAMRTLAGGSAAH